MTISARIAVLLPGTEKLEIKEAELPDPGPHQVIIKQFASGVCHSQLHQIHRPRTEAVVLGHESTGVVEAVGSAVTHVAAGDRVLVTWVPREIRADYRAPERAQLEFADGTSAVSQNVFTWASHTIADEQYVVKMPEGTPLDFGSIIGCAVMTGAGAVIHSANVQPGQSVAVWGVGGVGLSAIAAARNVGADPIIAVDLDAEKLAMARRFGATLTVNAAEGDAVAGVRALTPGDRPGDPGGVDWAFDCIGKSVTTQQILGAARFGHTAMTRGGTAVLVGVPTEPVTISSVELLLGEKKLLGSLGGSCSPDVDFPLFVQWYQQGKFELDQLVTTRYGLDDINQACIDLAGGHIAGRAILELNEA
ncbi:MAG: zinc-binding dehydrogenase [Frankiaceae bacterium]|jgi:Zn-dependent alcohol dehydrogenase|nr:zinc-binding dehydrogenase [Frankiaceae bacterium]